MIAAALLLWALVLAVGAPRVLAQASWPERAPRLGVLAWQAASGSLVIAVVLGGLALAVPMRVLSSGLAELLSHCVSSVGSLVRDPMVASATVAGIGLAAGVVIRLSVVVATRAHGANRQRRKHADALTLVGRRDPRLGAVVIDHQVPAAYCLPGRRRSIVLTTGALHVLDDAEVAAVLAHERAHLAARHHLAVSAAAALAEAFPRVPLLVAAAEKIPHLIEMAADDAAGTDRGSVAAALVALADGAAPIGTLAAGGASALARVRRLLRPAAPLPRGAVVVAVLTAGALLAGPAVLALAPAAVAGTIPGCITDVLPHA